MTFGTLPTNGAGVGGFAGNNVFGNPTQTSYTFATLPEAGPAGNQMYTSDMGLCISNGTAWTVIGSAGKFNTLPAAAALSSTDIVPVYQAGTGANVQTTYGSLVGFPGIVIASGDTTGATDYTNLFNAFNAAMSDSTGNFRTVTIFGQFYINQKIVITTTNTSVIAQQQFQIIGYGQTCINVIGTNLGAIEIQHGGGTPHGFSFENFGIFYQTQQTSSNTASVAIGFRTVAGTDSGATIFELFFDRLNIQKAFRGIGNTQISGSFTMWGMNITRCQVGGCAGAWFWFAGPSSVGQPNIKIDHVYCTSYAGGSEPGVRIDGGDSILITNFEVNNFQDQNIFNFSSSTFMIQRCKVETSTYSVAGTIVIFTTNSMGSIDGFNFINCTLTASNIYLISQGSGSYPYSINVRNITLGFASGTGTLTLYGGSSSNAHYISMDNPRITGLGSGPAVFRINNSGAASSSDAINFANPPGGYISNDNGDASVTWLPLSMQMNQIFNTPLTANRTFTLTAALSSVTADNSWEGATCTIVRTANATGAFNLTISASNPSSKVLAAGNSATYMYRRSLGGYVEVSSSSL